VTQAPAWRARQHDPKRQRNKICVSVSAETHEALRKRAEAEGCSMRWLADVFINRALDEATAP
jgi:predicted HicB family RNase H-like nuclease